ncbi:MAG: DUF4287 domain-containing protein [Vicinamibacteria bacterium]|jgi:hypothetical protein|nr:DUF4287 domain-containing protein [Vicinamibacteria bacterium]
MDVDKAVATQIANIEKKTGKTLAQLRTAIGKCGRQKHGEIRSWLMETYGLGHGDANTLTHVALKSDGTSAAKEAGASTADVLGGIYTGKKAHQRPIHDALMAGIETFGEFEIAPKKGYVSLRRKKQFAMLGPRTNERFELGLNLREKIDDPRVKALPPGGMCQYVVALTAASEVDAKLIAVVKRAYDAAG